MALSTVHKIESINTIFVIFNVQVKLDNQLLLEFSIKGDSVKEKHLLTYDPPIKELFLYCSSRI